jgi:hypothetical protein
MPPVVTEEEAQKQAATEEPYMDEENSKLIDEDSEDMDAAMEA